MKFRWHILIGFVSSYILVYFFNFSIFSGLIIFLSSWMIDTDHYFWFAIISKNWNPLKAINWYKKSTLKWQKLTIKERNEFKRGVFIFHGIIFWIILILLSYFNKFFLWILIGVAIHITADLVDLIKRKEPLYNKIFPCYVIRRNKNKKSLDKL